MVKKSIKGGERAMGTERRGSEHAIGIKRGWLAGWLAARRLAGCWLAGWLRAAACWLAGSGGAGLDPEVQGSMLDHAPEFASSGLGYSCSYMLIRAAPVSWGLAPRLYYAIRRDRRSLVEGSKWQACLGGEISPQSPIPFLPLGGLTS